MEIPSDIQNKLKCSKCGALLSCGPVYISHEASGAICGRCSHQQSPPTASRNGPYEATASLLVFPCVYAARGCQEKQAFHSNGHPPHELTCKYRTFVCPAAQQSTTPCTWSGSWLNLKEHFDETHAQNVFESPCQPPRLDLTRTNVQTYLITAFSFLFLVRFKVCLATGNLFHSVWMFGDPKSHDKFTFAVDVEASNLKFSHRDRIQLPAHVIQQDPITVCTTLKNLLRILDGNYHDAKFTVRIQALFKFCLNCLRPMESDANAKFCKKCECKLRKCKFHKKNCLFVDVNKKKCEKHENMFCEYQSKCCKCNVDFVEGGSLIEHLESSASCQNVVKSNIDSIVRLTPSSSFNYILFSGNWFGTVICLYKLSYSNLDVYFYTTLPSHELNNLKCSIELIDPQTKRSQILVAEYLANNWRDWHVSKEMVSFFSLENSGLDIKVYIDKI